MNVVLKYDENVRQSQERLLRFRQLALMLIFALISFCIVLAAIIPYSENIPSLEAIFQNWKIVPITQVYFGNNCSELLASYVVPGTQSGCLCGRDIFKGVCPQSCEVIPAMDSLNLTHWIDESICVVRGGPTFYQLLVDQLYSQQDCLSKGYVLCIAQNQFYCVKATSCPITDIQISEQEFNTTYTLINKTNAYLYSSSIANYRPIVFAQMVSGAGVCMDANQRSWSISDYTLNYPQATNCTLDTRYRNISSLNISTLLSTNSQQINLPLYPLSQVITLMTMEYIRLQPGCYMNNLITNDFTDGLLLLLVVQLSLSLVFIIAIIVLICNEIYEFAYKPEKSMLYFYVGRWMIQIPHCIFLILGFNQAMDTNNQRIETYLSGCFDSFTQQLLSDDIRYDRTRALQSFLLVLLLIFISLDILMTIVQILQRHRKLKDKRLNVRIQNYKQTRNTQPHTNISTTQVEESQIQLQ